MAKINLYIFTLILVLFFTSLIINNVSAQSVTIAVPAQASSVIPGELVTIEAQLPSGYYSHKEVFNSIHQQGKEYFNSSDGGWNSIALPNYLLMYYPPGESLIDSFFPLNFINGEPPVGCPQYDIYNSLNKDYYGINIIDFYKGYNITENEYGGPLWGWFRAPCAINMYGYYDTSINSPHYGNYITATPITIPPCDYNGALPYASPYPGTIMNPAGMCLNSSTSTIYVNTRDLSATPSDLPYTFALYNLAQDGNYVLIGSTYLNVNITTLPPYTQCNTGSCAYANVFTGVNGQQNTNIAYVPIGFPAEFTVGEGFPYSYLLYWGYQVAEGGIPLTTYYNGSTNCDSPSGACRDSSNYFYSSASASCLYGSCHAGIGPWPRPQDGSTPGYIFTQPYYNYTIDSYNATPDPGAQTLSNGWGDFAAAGIVTTNGFINCTGITVDGKSGTLGYIAPNSIYCVYWSYSQKAWFLSSGSNTLTYSELQSCESHVQTHPPPGGAFLCANGIVNLAPSSMNPLISGDPRVAYLPPSESSTAQQVSAYSSVCQLNSNSPAINCYYSTYSGPSLSNLVCPGGTCISGGSLTLGPVLGAICNVYTIVNTALFILALVIMLLGGTLYAGAHFLPSQTRGMIQGYAMGMIIGGIVAVIIAMVAPWVLSIVTNTPLTTIVSVCSS